MSHRPHPDAEQRNRKQRAFDAFIGREMARLYGRTVAGHDALLEEWIVLYREFPTWQDAMVARCDASDVERYIEALQAEWGKP